jgi:hypothetical protein
MTNFKYDKIKIKPYLNKYTYDKIIIQRFNNKHCIELKNILNLYCNVKLGKNNLFQRMNIITKYYEYIIQNIDDFYYVSEIDKFKRLFYTFSIKIEDLINQCNDKIKILSEDNMENNDASINFLLDLQKINANTKNQMIPLNNNDKIKICNNFLDFLKNVKFQLIHNYTKSKVNIIREELCIKVFHPKYVDKLWTFDDC